MKCTQCDGDGTTTGAYGDCTHCAGTGTVPDLLPDDAAGTVRAGGGLIAVRAPGADPDALDWYVFDVGADQLDHEAAFARIAQLPIVYQLIGAKVSS